MWTRRPLRTRVGCLFSLLFLFACAKNPQSVREESATEEPGPAWLLADEYLEAYLERYPETATWYGIPGYPHDRFFDNSLDALEAWQTREDQWLARLNEMPANHPPGSPEWTVRGILLETLQASVAYRACRMELWGVSQIEGWQVYLPDLADIQPLEDEASRREALARGRDTVRFLDTEIENLRQGLELGYSSPRHNVQLVIAQLHGLLEPDSLLSSPVERDASSAEGDPTFQHSYRELLDQEIRPAIRRYLEFLETEYAPEARETISVAENPGGAECYRAAVRNFSALDMDPQEIHDLGHQQMAVIQAEMQVIAERSFDTDDLPRLLHQVTNDPAYAFSSREEILDYAHAAYERAREAMPNYFGILPRSAVTIEPYPAFREDGGTGEYLSPTIDGSRPGLFYIPVKHPKNRPRATYETLTFHETIPGHHLQASIAVEAEKSSHPLTRYLDNHGYSEGWGLYSERLADEMGLYSSDLDRLGMLGDQAARAARLVLDTGIHELGWSRQQAIDYMTAHTTWPPQDVESEVDRYIVWPGQATAYMLGMLELRRLREQASTAFGDDFDLRKFHDLVLEEGGVTVAMVGEKIEHWIAQAN